MIPWIEYSVLIETKTDEATFILRNASTTFIFLNNIGRAFLNYLRPKWHSIVVITVSTVCKYYFKQKCVWSQIWKWGILIFREFLRCVTNYYYANGYCCYIVLISVYSPLFCTYYLVYKPTLFFFRSRALDVKAVMSCNQSCSSFNCRK